MRALVCRGAGEPLRVEEIEDPVPGEGEVLVRVRAAGICHSDLSMVNGTLFPSYPLILGHEAAGEVVGGGEHVVLNWAPPCRACWACRYGEPWLCSTTGTPSTPRGDWHVTLGLGALAELVAVPRKAIITVPQELAFPTAALLGCAVLTGLGAVQRTAGVAPGESAVVIGLGGVGLSAVIGLHAAGAGPIIAVDVSESKRDLALACGATDFVLFDDVKSIRGHTGGRGADHAFECVGRSQTIQAAWRLTRRGGRVTVVGMGAKDDMVSLGALDIFHSARTLRSSVYGSSDPDRDLPALASAVLDGTLDLSPLITATIDLDGAPDAFAHMGSGARTVVTFS
ncbi:MAG TPA: zinc-binding dehydrogenase [Candidatus Limnocylindrales bacterium]|nr:zinc-binding dehydrogenase [Candidatus Limnocylindrales bacterium]